MYGKDMSGQGNIRAQFGTLVFLQSILCTTNLVIYPLLDFEFDGR